VAGDLVAFSHHALDDVGPLCGRINRSLSNVDTSNKKCCLEAICGELVKHLVGVDVWTIVVGDGDSAWCLASVDALSSVCYIAFLWAGVIAGARATGSLVGVAARAEVDEAVRSSAVVLGGTTISLVLLVMAVDLFIEYTY
jgi:hypothetical protein